MSPKDPLPIFLPNLYLFPTLSSIVRDLRSETTRWLDNNQKIKKYAQATNQFCSKTKLAKHSTLLKQRLAGTVSSVLRRPRDSTPNNLSPLVLKRYDPHIVTIRCSLKRCRCLLYALAVFRADALWLSEDEDGFYEGAVADFPSGSCVSPLFGSCLVSGWAALTSLPVRWQQRACESGGDRGRVISGNKQGEKTRLNHWFITPWAQQPHRLHQFVL